MTEQTEFKLGDIVRMTKGEPGKPGWVSEVREVVVSEVREVVEWQSKGGQVALESLAAYEDRGWTVELIERPLPTKPGTIGWATHRGERGMVHRSAEPGAVWPWHFMSPDGSNYRWVKGEDLSDFTEAVLIPKDLADKVAEWADDEDGKWRAGSLLDLLEQIARHLMKGQDDD